MRTLISIMVASALVATSPLALAETASIEPAITEMSATADSPAEADELAAQANATEPPKPNTAPELPTCIPK